ncbi:glycoside hydrolase family 2 TIM barrel-domain containing protein [Gayadomonas joobiniege]|uniref:glycoside hydrolase family 2 TIM barrel-domain containing protein n=1 Tax=Gayadomonas joobiniege TaxID=1234606 RepID=UPI000370AE78|nr:glycoside hydrolase family 2 TIM barrel-domain containing protein [Gayadomonas joobiniege]
MFNLGQKLLAAKTVLIFLALLVSHSAFAQRLTMDLNKNWLFKRADIPAAKQYEFNDNDWKKVHVPHDWSFNNGVSPNGAQGANGGYYDGGIGWYRRTLSIDAQWLKKRIVLDFDGVYMNSELWVNGQYVGKKAYGYISFRYDITDYLKPGENQIAMRVDNSKEPSARWYHPAGIYAPVQLLVTENTYIKPNGVYVTTPKIDSNSAQILVQTEINKEDANKNVRLQTRIYSPSGKLVNQTEQAVCEDNSCTLKTNLTIPKPQLWSPDSPNLYQVQTSLMLDGRAIDETKTTFGVRSIKWETETGFWLNGDVVKLLGVSEHYEGGPVGGAWTKPLLRWKLALLKDMGVNAVRTAHNPYPPMFYELCDELGILVMDEIFDGWSKKAHFDYGQQAFADDWNTDLTEWVKRNRNHPSVVIYSVGNETRGEEIARKLVARVHELDNTRPVTSGHSASQQMDVYGVNGGSEKRQFFEKERPQKPFVATEAPHTWQTRGYYRSKTWFRDGNKSPKQGIFPLPDLTEKEIFHYEWADPKTWKNKKQHFNSSYDNATVRITARKNWELMRDLPWFSGHFRWTGYDYYGEAGYVHGGWPFRLFMGGALDVAGFKKDLFYFYQSQWTDEPMVHILPHWTHPRMSEGTKVPVWVYSNCEEVELFLNGKSLGTDKPGTKWDQMQAEWMVPWQHGTLRADCINQGQRVTSTEQTTADVPSQLTLHSETTHLTPAKDQVAVVTANLLDKNGVYYPYGENRIYYKLSGPATIRSLENGDPVDTAKNYGVNNRKAFMGATRAFIDIEQKNADVSLFAAAILGDKSLYTSNYVTIDTQQIDITGQSSAANIEIFYSTDGSQPDRNSQRYTKPFPVSAGTQVKAAVYQNGELLFVMQEGFADGSGLFWGDGKSAISYQAQSQQDLGMLAIDAKFSGATKKSDHLDFNGREGNIRWYQENDGEAGEFLLTFSYASKDRQSQRPMDLYLNNQKVIQIDFPATGAWSGQWKQISVKVNLVAGANNIELRTKGESGPNIKALAIEYASDKN